MARIMELKQNTQKIKPHKLEDGVTCEHQVVDDCGTPLLHLSTFGSNSRRSERKSSQSLQVNTTIAAELVGIMRKAFGDQALGIHPKADIAYPENEIIIEPTLLARAYQRHPRAFRQVVSSDEARGDIVAMAHRRKQVARFRRLLEDDNYFESEKKRKPARGAEAVWQEFFEHNPWIFGVSLAGQFLTSWDSEKLEKIVSGDSASSTGKRVDALLRTSGRIKSMVFAEIKTHKHPLLKRKPYRSGCWAPSDTLSGGVVQVQGTVHRAIGEMTEQLPDRASDGSDIPGEFTYLLRPRSYLVIGSLDSLKGGAGGDNRDKFRSFELFRRDLVEPEILTFDEVLARAEWAVESATAEPPSYDK